MIYPRKMWFYTDLEILRNTFPRCTSIWSFRLIHVNPAALLELRVHCTKSTVFRKYPRITKSFQNRFQLLKELSFSYQGLNDNDPRRYIIPNVEELARLKGYAGGAKENQRMFRSITDSTKQITRISFQVADIGSIKMKSLLAEIKPRVDSIFPVDKYDVKLTGNSIIFSRTTIIFLISKRVFSSQSCWSEQSCSFVYVIADGCNCLDPQAWLRYWSRLPWWDSSIFLLNRSTILIFFHRVRNCEWWHDVFSHEVQTGNAKVWRQYFQNRIHRDPWNRSQYDLYCSDPVFRILYFTASSFGGTSALQNAHFSNASHCYVEAISSSCQVYSCLLKNESLPKHSSKEPLIQVLMKKKMSNSENCRLQKAKKRWVKSELSIHLPTTNNQ